MKAATISELKKELQTKSHSELLSYCLRLSRFKKENKELITFLLFEANDLPVYIENVKQETTGLFDEINTTAVYYIKKSVRKILRLVNKHIRFAGSKQVEAEILIHFCNCITRFSIPVSKSKPLKKLYETQLKKIGESMASLHADLQYDLARQLESDR
jgi:hypothetical protein